MVMCAVEATIDNKPREELHALGGVHVLISEQVKWEFVYGSRNANEPGTLQ